VDNRPDSVEKREPLWTNRVSRGARVVDIPGSGVDHPGPKTNRRGSGYRLSTGRPVAVPGPSRRIHGRGPIVHRVVEREHEGLSPSSTP